MNKLEWNFENGKTSSQVVVQQNGTEVLFNPIYSLGTAVCVGNTVLEKNFHHFWEFELSHPVYGTAFMVGIGSDTLEINEFSHCFLPFLGRNSVSWGYGHEGKLIHDGLETLYHSKTGKWKQKDILGVHLDLCRGTMAFYLNKKPLGIAFKNIPKNMPLYPMVSSSAAKTGIKLLTSQSYPDSLSFNCIQKLGHMIKNSKCDITLKDCMLPPGLQRLVENNLCYLVGTTKVPKLNRKFQCIIESDDTDNDIKSTKKTSADKVQRLKVSAETETDSETGEDYKLFSESKPSKKIKTMKSKRRRKILKSKSKLMDSSSDSEGFF